MPNGGLEAAIEAAKAVSAKLSAPQFKNIFTKPTDFNDLHQLEGLETVKTQIENATMPIETDNETFDRLAKLSATDYDRCREHEAKRLKIRVATLDAEIQKHRPQSPDSLQGTLNPARVEPWPEPVDGANLLNEIRSTNKRFMVLPSHADVLLTVWELHTYVFDCFSYTPYLHVKSPEKECGKSTLAELMNHLCANATTPGGMSAAAMYRRIERARPTLLLDEWDTLSDENRQGALNALNTGFKWNGVYTICVGDDHNDRDFHTFCPKAIFGLSETKLPDTTRSRCFVVALEKKLPDERIEKLTRKFDGSTLRKMCLRWANDNRKKLPDIKPAMPSGLSARQEDISESLLAIADLCGGEWPGLVRQAILHFCGKAEGEEGDVKRELLKDIKDGFSKQPQPDRFSSAAMRDYLNALEHRPWRDWNDSKGISQRQISTRLGEYGIKSRNIKTCTGKVQKGYYFDDLRNAFSRYLLNPLGTGGYSATEAENIDGFSLFQSATSSGSGESRNIENPNEINNGSGVARQQAKELETKELLL
jgi:putative DNA primase/helicase